MLLRKKKKRIKSFKVTIDDACFAVQAYTYTEAEVLACRLLNSLQISPTGGFFLLEEI